MIDTIVSEGRIGFFDTVFWFSGHRSCDQCNKSKACFAVYTDHRWSSEVPRTLCRPCISKENDVVWSLICAKVVIG